MSVTSLLIPCHDLLQRYHHRCFFCRLFIICGFLALLFQRLFFFIAHLDGGLLFALCELLQGFIAFRLRQNFEGELSVTIDDIVRIDGALWSLFFSVFFEPVLILQIVWIFRCLFLLYFCLFAAVLIFGYHADLRIQDLHDDLIVLVFLHQSAVQVIEILVRADAV